MSAIAKCADKRVIDEALKRIGIELFENNTYPIRLC
jgi:hypothetical protein